MVTAAWARIAGSSGHTYERSASFNAVHDEDLHKCRPLSAILLQVAKGRPAIRLRTRTATAARLPIVAAFVIIVMHHERLGELCTRPYETEEESGGVRRRGAG